ncbi:MAG TPA: TIGR03936 family radical SAM-associated protein [Anaerolineae bacterium]|nr:TIGR03936 family radical SAM-associated protein [Anaerolineae bacterium]HPL26893.1 TIGR03936 family radical SAM-associated protein [Anaerolineae bacterium]HPL26902.1 TIGR03936 family radical SAM-associated protein [Anaerolineae bacterium]
MPVKQPQREVTAPVQRLGIAFAVAGGARYVGGLDMGRAWVRACRRLGLPLAYSFGFNPHPRVSIAAPLPVGFAAERELVEVHLDARVDPQELAARLPGQLPPGLTLRGVEELPLDSPPLPARVQAAEYLVRFLDAPPADLAERLARLLEADSLPFTRVRAVKQVSFDLRPRILEAQLDTCMGQPLLTLRLVHGPSGAARPEDVLTALGVDPMTARATRTGLVLRDEGSGQAQA